MGKITFARVDERLVHAQVMMTVAGSSGASAVYVVNDETANDDFMKMIFENAASRTGLKVKIMTKDNAIAKWHENQFGDDKVLLITKTIEDAGYIVNKGITFEFLNVGGNSLKPGATPIINEVAITNDQGELLKNLAESNGINIYFQSTPSTTRVELGDALKKINV